jgi:hypothetical protein
VALWDYAPLHPDYGASARFVAAASGRTHDKDSFAAPKVLPFNDFLHFAQCD